MFTLEAGRLAGHPICKLLPARLEQLAEAGLKTVYISIDSARMDEHEINRGLKALGERILALLPGCPP